MGRDEGRVEPWKGQVVWVEVETLGREGEWIAAPFGLRLLRLLLLLSWG